MSMLTEFRDFALKGKIISTYPNDDDAVLFWYKQTIDRHGWEWMEKFMQQEPPNFDSQLVGSRS